MCLSSASRQRPTAAEDLLGDLRLRVGDARAARDHGHPLADHGGGVGHRADDRAAGQPAGELIEPHARGDADHQLARERLAHLRVAQQRADLVRLHADEHHVAGLDRLEVVALVRMPWRSRSALTTRRADRWRRPAPAASRPSARSPGRWPPPSSRSPSTVSVWSLASMTALLPHNPRQVKCSGRRFPGRLPSKPASTWAMRTASWSSWARTWSCTTASSWRSARIMGLVESLARLRKAGREVVLVSSGAVGMGMRVLGLKERPRSLGYARRARRSGRGTS